MPDSQRDFLRPVQGDDLPRLLAWRNHDDIRRVMFNAHTITADETSQWFERESANPLVHLLLFERDSEPAGYVRLHVLAEGGTADWGFYAAPGSPPGTGRRLGL